MTNKQTILITGATGSIGGGAAVALAKRGARVVLLGRRLETLEAKADSIRVALSEARIESQDTDIATLVVDFSDMESVRLTAAEAMNRFPKIHGLILSAVANVQHGGTILPSGHEVMFATNVMGPFLFTQLLLERMEQSDGMVLHVIHHSIKKSTGMILKASEITGQWLHMKGPRQCTERSLRSWLDDMLERSPL